MGRPKSSKNEKRLNGEKLLKKFNINKNIFYFSTICKRNHNYKNTGFSLRRSANGHCLECEKISNKKDREIKIKERKESNKRYYQNNKEKIRLKRKEYYNKPEIKKKKIEYSKNYIKNKTNKDPNFRILKSLRGRVASAIKKNRSCVKSAHTLKLLGCTIKEVREHLEKQFKEGMTWDNYGNGMDKWSIDHILPCSSFDLIDPEQQIKCFHYTNLQPLWFKENSSKGSRLDYKF